MSITITDPALLTQFAQASGITDVCDPSGRVIGTFVLEGAGRLPAGVKSPVSKEEFEEARRSPDSGITLNEFWNKVERGEWR